MTFDTPLTHVTARLQHDKLMIYRVLKSSSIWRSGSSNDNVDLVIDFRQGEMAVNRGEVDGVVHAVCL